MLIKIQLEKTHFENLLIQMTFMARLAYINQEKWEKGGQRALGGELSVL